MSSMNSMLENICEEIINVFHQTFTKNAILSKYLNLKTDIFIQLLGRKQADT